MSSVATEPARCWHTLAVDAAGTALQSDLHGLSQTEASRRLGIHGPNELQAAARVTPWAILLAQFKNVLIIILLIATALSACLGHGVEAIVITVIVLFAIILGFIQEYRADRAIEALRQMAAPTATAIRDGREIEVPARDLVPGDVVLLAAGDRVPADLRLTETVNLQAEEAALTGESLAVEKHVAVLADAALPLGDRRNLAFAGTAVTYGRGRGLVVATGMHTEFGKIAQLLQTVETGRTPLQRDLDHLGHSLAKAAVVVVALIVVLGLVRGEPFIEMLVFGVALAVAVVPEALPAVVTISLAIGVQRMVRRHALMRRLPAVETLGSTTVICSDKTGTLTRDEMTARRVVVAGQGFEISGAGYEPVGQFSRDGAVTEPTAALQQCLRAGALASDASVVRHDDDGLWHVKGDPTEGALVVAAAKAGMHKAELEARYPRTHEVPFTSETKRMVTVHQGPEGPVAFMKGAPEVVIAACTRQLTAAGVVPLDTAGRRDLLDAAHRMAGEALRVLAVASREGATPATAEAEHTFLGLVGMIDPPRAEAAAAIASCEQAGIRPIMITGDHPTTAQAIARELGLLKHGRVVTGAELEAMGDDELAREVMHIEVYARVSPAHKLRVVSALQQQGQVVAMTGDGVNDAPALKKADIGVAMGMTGTDVSKEAAAMTLTDDNFASIVAAVEEGRGIFGNIKKYLMYLLSSNIGEIGLMAGASLAGMPLPLSAVQILYVNLATDGLPALALAVDPPEPDLMQRPPRRPGSRIFSRPVIFLMVLGGVWSAAVNLGLFSWALRSGRSTAEAMTMVFVSLVLIQFFKAYNFRSDRFPVVHRTFANRWLNAAIGWELLLLGLVVYLPFLHQAFGTFSLTWHDWAIVVGAAFTVTPVIEIGKWCVRRHWLGRLD